MAGRSLCCLRFSAIVECAIGSLGQSAESDAPGKGQRHFDAGAYGDVFDEIAINNLYHKLPPDALLTAHGFTFSPAKDKVAAQVDMTLDFYKVSDKSSVTVQ